MDLTVDPQAEDRKTPAAVIWLIVVILSLMTGYAGAWVVEAVQTQSLQAPIESAPDFELTRFDNGQSLNLSELKGKGIVLNFWASWCVPCQNEMPALEKAWQRYQDVGIVFVGVNLWDEKDNALAFLKEHAVTYPNGIDSQDQISSDYNIQGIPTTWFIAPDGTVVSKVMGPLDLEMLDEAIALIRPDNHQ